MRGLRLATLALSVALISGFSLPAAAAGDNEAACQEQGNVTPAEAAEALQASLPSGVTLGTGSQEQILGAFQTASEAHHGYAAEIAGLIAIGRPDLVDALRDTVQSFCAASAEAILKKIASSLSNPSADQLAALVPTDTAPAAGGDPNGSNE